MNAGTNGTVTVEAGADEAKGLATHMIAVMGAIGAGRRTTEAIGAHLPLSAKQVSSATSRLVARRLIERVEAGVFALSPAGRAFLAEGGTLKVGRYKRLSGQRYPRRDTLRARAWRVMRLKKTFTLSDLITVAAVAGDKDPYSAIGAYVRLLEAFGYVVADPVRASDGKPTSNGVKRWRLIRDTGSEAPTPKPASGDRPARLFDHNTRTLVDLVGGDQGGRP
ncbi:MAG: hypothetical protein JNK56_39490 [Myxococcales bacterium]|nr:hypothetical protein [Myxococcales bacterium]